MFNNHAAILFLHSDAYDGSDTLGEMNHCVFVQRYSSGVMLFDSAGDMAVTRFRKDENIFELSKDANRFKNEKRISKLSNNRSRKSSVQKGVSVPNTVQQDFQRKIKKFQYLKKKFPKKFTSLEETKINCLSPEKKIPYSNLPTDKIDRLNNEYNFYRTVGLYRAAVKASLIIEVGVYEYPEEKDLLGRPMYCHNYTAQTIGCDVGNVLTVEHFIHKLLDNSGKTNFISRIIYDER